MSGQASKTIVASGDVEVSGDGDTSTGAASMNLAKNLVGSGVLSLSSGVAAFSSNPSAIYPSLALLVLSALLSAYGFFLIGRVCEETGTSSFGGAWKGTIGRGAWIPKLTVVLECLGGSVIYAMVLGDVFGPMLQSFGAPSYLATRSGAIVGLAATVLFPLCCLRSFSQLAKFSMLGTIASSYVVLFVTWRFFDGSYAPGGMFFKPAGLPILDPSAGIMSSSILILLSILSTAYLVHFNAPQMYAELRPPSGVSDNGQKPSKLPRFGRLALIGFGIGALQYALVMVFGFLTFGSATEGNLLLNYASSDVGAIIARIAIGISTVFGYPMQFAGLRSGIMEAMGVKELSDGKHQLLTAATLSAVVFMACSLKNLGRFQAIEGALLASLLIYIAPPLMAMRLQGVTPSTRVRFNGMIAWGIFVTVVGCVVTMGPLGG